STDLPRSSPGREQGPAPGRSRRACPAGGGPGPIRTGIRPLKKHNGSAGFVLRTHRLAILTGNLISASLQQESGRRVMAPRTGAGGAVAGPRRPARRRGVVLILVLAMLGLLALVGITFVALSNQARVNATNFTRSLTRPLPKELMFFALSQLIQD